jgi:hypothetical protein
VLELVVAQVLASGSGAVADELKREAAVRMDELLGAAPKV